jgi:hypothetical protein
MPERLAGQRLATGDLPVGQLAHDRSDLFNLQRSK